MKKIFLVITILSAIFIFNSCKKSSSGSSTPSQSMTATVNGAKWTSSYITDNTASSGGDTILYIMGQNTAGQMIHLEVLAYHGKTGSYNFADTNLTCRGYYYKDSASYSTALSGTLNISTVSTNSIAGTFSFTTSDTTVITGGTFTAPGL